MIFDEYQETPESIHRRIEQIFSLEIPADRKNELYIRMLGWLDMTTLEGSDTENRVISLCEKSRFSLSNDQFPDAAAVCVYPSLVRIARKSLQGTAIRVASVAGGFPSGQTGLKVKLEEVKWAISEGADEIDTVISRGKLIQGNDSEVFDEIAAIREVCGDIHLKVILETGELPSIGLIRQASALAIEAGAGFIKTSTGKIDTGATPEAMVIMLDTIREYLEKTGKSIGIKPAGGIRTPAQALGHFMLVDNILGSDWLDPSFFRMGASSLADALLHEITS